MTRQVFRWRGGVCVSGALAMLLPGALAGQQVVLSRPLQLPVREPVRVELRAPIALPIAAAGANARPRTAFLARWTATRADSLVLQLPAGGPATDATIEFTVPVASVAQVQVRERQRWRARLDTGGESALYGMLGGGVVGGVVAALTRVTRDRGVALGALGGMGGGFLAGVASRPPTGYGVRWRAVNLRVEP